MRGGFEAEAPFVGVVANLIRHWRWLILTAGKILI
jgi:hypothetical protein